TRLVPAANGIAGESAGRAACRARVASFQTEFAGDAVDRPAQPDPQRVRVPADLDSDLRPGVAPGAAVGQAALVRRQPVPERPQQLLAGHHLAGAWAGVGAVRVAEADPDPAAAPAGGPLPEG